MAASPEAVSASTAGAQQSAASVHDRLKVFLGGDSTDSQPKATSDPDGADGRVGNDPADGASGDEGSLSAGKPVPKAKGEPEAEDQDDSAADETSDDAQSEDWKPSDLSELLTAAFGDESEKGLDLPVRVKVDGKEGTATLRDLIKSYQLDGHINQKLASVDTDRKALQAKQEEFQRERADKLLRLDAGLKTLERSLLAEFQSVDWQKLASEDPTTYNAQVVAFQQRNAQLQDIAAQISQEQQQHQVQQVEAQKRWLEEQRTMLQAKVPEWADETRRSKDKAEILAYLTGHGITKEEFEAIGDHRIALVVRDAWKWAQLQKGKPAVLKQVKAAPRLLKPGTQQSKDASSQFIAQKERDRLRQTGRVKDAVAPLKRHLFG